MSYILIHSNNTSLIKSKHFGFDKCLAFIPAPNKEIDLYMSEFISQQIIPKTPKAIFIKYALTDNYISFLGVRLAMHIRLSQINTSISEVPIILVGEETVIEISKLSDIASLIGTSGIYHSNENEISIMKFIEEIESSKLQGLKNWPIFLNKIDIPAPSNYTSHHSITNDWSLIRWSKYVGCKDSIKIEAEIVSSLYYRFISKKLPISETEIGANVFLKGNGNVLIIDDEWNKGWFEFYQKIFSTTPDIKLIPFNYDFKGKKRDDVVSDIMSLIKSSSVDLVILDLRLCDEDFYAVESFKDLSGFKLLEEIKKYNKGMQTIIVSASNKIWNYTYAIDSYADDYLLKESPENSQDEKHTSITIKNLRATIESSLQKKYLKEIWQQIKAINLHFDTKINNETTPAVKRQKRQFLGEINQFLDIFFDNISSRKSYPPNAFQMLFVIIEILNNDLIDSNNHIALASGKYNWQIRRFSTNLKHFSKTNTAITCGSDLETDKRSIPWDQKTFNTAYHLGVNLNQLLNLSKLMAIRHEFIHQDLTTSQKVEPTLDNTKELFKMVHTMCLSY